MSGRIKQDRALGELVSRLPEYLFEVYRKDCLFYSLVRRSIESCDNYTQFLEKAVEYYVRLKQADTEKEIDKAMKEPVPHLIVMSKEEFNNSIHSRPAINQESKEVEEVMKETGMGFYNAREMVRGAAPENQEHKHRKPAGMDWGTYWKCI